MGILLVCHELNRKSPSVIVIKPPQDSNASSNWVLSLSKQKKTTLSSDSSKTNCFFLMGYDILMQLGFPLAGPFANFQQDTCGQSVNPPSQKKHVSAGEYVVFLSLFAITTYHSLVVQ